MKEKRCGIFKTFRVPCGFARCRSKLGDTSGSSIIIALVFFLICAIIGSIVLTAASVNSKATATYQETQQAEYTVTSAADLLGSTFAGTKVTFAYDQEGNPIFSGDAGASYQGSFQTLPNIWEAYGDAIWPVRTVQGTSAGLYTVPETLTVSAESLDDVKATISFDRDLNITLTLSLDSDAGAANGYSVLVDLQATPEFDAEGKLLSVSWDSYTVAKAASATEWKAASGGEAS